jgi:hypothetical protein
MMNRSSALKFAITATGVAIVLSGCSTLFGTSESRFSDLSEDRVLARIEGTASRPDWLDRETLDHRDGKWLILGFAIVPESVGAEGALSAAERRARHELSSAVFERLESILSLLDSQSGSLMTDRNEAQRFREHLDQNLPVIVQLKHQYWEQVPQRFRAFARVEVAAPALRKLVLETAQSLEAENADWAPLARAVRTHIDTVVDFDSHEVAPLFQLAPSGQN